MSKTRRISRKLLSMLIVLLMTMGIVAMPLAGAAEPVSLAEWTLTEALAPAPGTPATGGLMQSKSFLSSTATYSGFTAGNGTVYYNNWSVGGYWEIATSTAGYENLSLEFSSYGSNTGPKNFAAYIADGDGAFNKIAGSDYTLTATATSGTARNIKVLLPEAAENAEVVRIRLVVENNVSINDGVLAGTGTSRIGNVRLTGEAGEFEDPDPITMAAWNCTTAGAGAVTAFPATGGAVGFNTNVMTLQTASGAGSFTKAVAAVGGVPVSAEASGSSWAAWSQTVTEAMYWRLALNTKGYKNVELAFHGYGTATSPANWEAKYSTDGITYQSFVPAKTYTVDVTNAPAAATAIKVDLGVLDNADGTVYVGLFATSAATNATGNNRLCNVLVSGVSLGGGGGDPDPGDVCDDCGEDPCVCDDEPPGPVVITVAEAITKPNAEVVTVEGILVYNTRNGAGTSDNGVYLQDESGAGLNVRPGTGTISSTQVRNLIGQKVRVTGEINIFSGLVQLQNRSGSSPQLFTIETLDPNPIMPTPTPISIQDISAFTHPFMLISLENVKLVSKNDTFTGGHSSYTIERDGVTATLYGPVPMPEGIAVGDWITITKGIMTIRSGIREIYVNSDSAADIIPGVEPPPPGERGTVAEWISPTVADVITATGGEYAADSKLSIVGTTATTLNWANAAINRAGGFDNKVGTAYWLFATSSEEFKDVRVSFSLRSSATGPRDFRVQYSTDGVIWRDANDPTIVVPSALGINEPASQFAKTLPVGANGAEKLFIRLVVDSTASANGGTIAAGGTNSINNIVITGEFIVNENQLSAPSSDTPSGAIPLGHVVNFTPDAKDVGVPGYAIMVSADDGATWASAPGGAYTVTSLPVTILVRASAPDKVNSRALSFTFTQAKLPQVTASRNSGAVIPGATIRLDNAVDGVTIKYQINAGAALDYTQALVLADELFIGNPATFTVTAWAEKAGYITGDSATFSYTKAVVGGEKVYFGQIHSHSNLSDGVGEVEEAYRYARDVAGLDFFAVTDHSNSFEGTNSINPATIDLDTHNATNAIWQRGLAAAASAYREDFISFYGYEMTWSGGPGHINTFNTGGFVSRQNSALNAKTNDAGLRAYYELLTRHPDSISMFNHPGTTFGTFNNFAYHDPVVNQRITLIEVGNGEGAVGSGGYWKSYNEFILALDKGWKLAPVNSQDNHLGAWGNSNTARTAIWTNDLSLGGVYQALRDMRVYSTEVADLEIVYHVNGQPLGSTLDVVPQTANFTAQISNPTATNRVKSVELVTNGGARILRDTPNTQNYTYSKTVENPAPGYYFLWVVVSTPEGDRIAVTAPVWLGEGKLAGFSGVTTNVIMPVTTEEIVLTASFFNNEIRPATIMSIRYTDQNGAVLFEDNALNQVLAPNGGTFDHSTAYIPTVAGDTTITVVAVIRFSDGTDRTVRFDITYDVRDIERLVFIGVDAAHNNAYVAGQYRDAIRNFINIAADLDVRTVMLNTPAEIIAAAQNPRFGMLVFSSPDRHTSVANHLSYSNEVIEAVAAFAKAGNTVLINGLGNWNERSSRVPGYENSISGNQNRLLEAIGAHIRVSEDSAYDNVKNRAGNHTPLLNAADNYELEHPLLAGVLPHQSYSNYSGSSLYVVDGAGAVVESLGAIPASVSPIVWGNATTYSSNENPIAGRIQQGGPRYGDQEAAAGYGPGRLLIAASETVNYDNGNTANVLVTNAVMHSDFEVREPDNAAELPNSNYNIALNLIKSIAPQPVITDIADAKELPQATRVTVEGTVTSNVYTGDNAVNTGFFDSIYIQDETGGINLFPVSSGVVLGQKVRVSGAISEFMGEIQILVSRIEVIDAEINEVEPTEVTTEEAMSPENTGLLVLLTGSVSGVIEIDGLVSQFILTDESGVGALIYINAYITDTVDLSFVEEGAIVIVVGFASIGENHSGDPAHRIRVRDRSEIVFVASPRVLIDVKSSASVRVIPGNMNELTIKVTEHYSDGSIEVVELSIMIRNNAAGTYSVGVYQVYVDTKGNDQIRECRIVS